MVIFDQFVLARKLVSRGGNAGDAAFTVTALRFQQGTIFPAGA